MLCGTMKYVYIKSNLYIIKYNMMHVVEYQKQTIYKEHIKSVSMYSAYTFISKVWY